MLNQSHKNSFKFHFMCVSCVFSRFLWSHWSFFFLLPEFFHTCTAPPSSAPPCSHCFFSLPASSLFLVFFPFLTSLHLQLITSLVWFVFKSGPSSSHLLFVCSCCVSQILLCLSGVHFWVRGLFLICRFFLRCNSSGFECVYWVWGGEHGASLLRIWRWQLEEKEAPPVYWQQYNDDGAKPAATWWSICCASRFKTPLLTSTSILR